MSTIQSGGCACRSVRYKFNSIPTRTINCHCRDCQRSSGAAMATVTCIAKEDFLISGTTSFYSYTGDSGKPAIRYFCPTCGNPIYSELKSKPSFVFIRIASLDSPEIFTPSMQIYMSSALPWVCHQEELEMFERYP